MVADVLVFERRWRWWLFTEAEAEEVDANHEQRHKAGASENCSNDEPILHDECTKAAMRTMYAAESCSPVQTLTHGLLNTAEASRLKKTSRRISSFVSATPR